LLAINDGLSTAAVVVPMCNYCKMDPAKSWLLFEHFVQFGNFMLGVLI